MKLIQRLTLLSSVALLAGACDLQQTFDERIDDKQLLVLSPDFAETSVQLVFRDPETLAVLDEDFEVTVYSNKRLVDLNGNYKNEFIARGGVMEFSVSPEETVSEGDPLEISVYAKNADSSKLLSFSDHTIEVPDFKSISLIPELNEYNIEDIPNEPVNVSASEEVISKSVSDLELELSFNGRTISDYGNCFFGRQCFPSTYLIASGQYIYRGAIDEYYTFRAWLIFYFGSRTQGYQQGEPPNSLVLTDDLDIEVVGPLSLAKYVWNVEFWNSDKELIKYTISSGDYYSVWRYSRDSRNNNWLVGAGKGRFDTKHRVTIPAGNYIGKFKIDTYPNDTYKACDEGFNLLIEGATPGLNTNLMYKATRNNDGKIFGIANLNFKESSYLYNSLQDIDGEQYIGASGNTLEFAENAQYIIEPQVINLGGEELCGKTFIIKLIPRDALKQHQLNLSMRNENQNVGLALTFSALLRKQGQGNTSWETINFKQGSASVYLEEGSTYEVKLTLADEPFEFTFTNDLSLVEAAVQATLRNVTRIKDIKYTITQSTNSNTIGAEIVFYEGQSLID